MTYLTILQTCSHCGGSGMGGWGMAGGTWFAFGFVFLLAILFLTLFVGGAYLIASGGGAGGSEAGSGSASESDRAMELLREAYARGDLGHDEFEERASRVSKRSSGER